MASPCDDWRPLPAQPRFPEADKPIAGVAEARPAKPARSASPAGPAEARPRFPPRAPTLRPAPGPETPGPAVDRLDRGPRSALGKRGCAGKGRQSSPFEAPNGRQSQGPRPRSRRPSAAPAAAPTARNRQHDRAIAGKARSRPCPSPGSPAQGAVRGPADRIARFWQLRPFHTLRKAP